MLRYEGAIDLPLKAGCNGKHSEFPPSVSHLIWWSHPMALHQGKGSQLPRSLGRLWNPREVSPGIAGVLSCFGTAACSHPSVNPTVMESTTWPLGSTLSLFSRSFLKVGHTDNLVSMLFIAQEGGRVEPKRLGMWTHGSRESRASNLMLSGPSCPREWAQPELSLRITIALSCLWHIRGKNRQTDSFP